MEQPQPYRTGDICQKSGMYIAVCCNQLTWVEVHDPFPQCAKCNADATFQPLWLAVWAV